MTLSKQFLDELRARTRLSDLIGGKLKLTRAGHEFSACCPFHGEKTPSFTVSDAKGFYHCFGCGAHGDAIRWLTDHEGLPFREAVAELAARAGLELPSASPAAAARAARIAQVRPALAACAEYFSHQIVAHRAVGIYLESRGISRELADRFGLGYAPGGKDYCRHLGIDPATALAAGLMWQAETETGTRTGMRFADRIMVPVHDARGQIISFGGRDFSSTEFGGRAAGSGPGAKAPPKYKNGSDTELFDKGRVLFNLHRAVPQAKARPGNPGRLIVVEGYFDVIALAGAGVEEVVAPMGTALTPQQLDLLWRVHPCPVLMFDGDKAGQKAALRACETALPLIGPGRSLRVALCPAGQDPDDVVRGKGSGRGGKRAIDELCDAAQPLSGFLFERVVERLIPGFASGHQARRHDPEGGISPGAPTRAQRDGTTPTPTPEDISGIWFTLETMAGHIGDAETRLQYSAAWRARFEREVSLAPRALPDLALVTFRQSNDGEYEFPDTEDEAERRLIYIVQNLLALRASERAAVAPIRDAKKTVKAMAKVIGLDSAALDAVCKAIEADPGEREQQEMTLALYRRVLGIKGPMLDAMLPPAPPLGVSGRAGAAGPGVRAIKAASPARRLAWHEIEGGL